MRQGLPRREQRDPVRVEQAREGVDEVLGLPSGGGDGEHGAAGARGRRGRTAASQRGRGSRADVVGAPRARASEGSSVTASSSPSSSTAAFRAALASPLGERRGVGRSAQQPTDRPRPLRLRAAAESLAVLVVQHELGADETRGAAVAIEPTGSAKSLLGDGSPSVRPAAAAERPADRHRAGFVAPSPEAPANTHPRGGPLPLSPYRRAPPRRRGVSSRPRLPGRRRCRTRSAWMPSTTREVTFSVSFGALTAT